MIRINLTNRLPFEVVILSNEGKRDKVTKFLNENDFMFNTLENLNRVQYYVTCDDFIDAAKIQTFCDTLK